MEARRYIEYDENGVIRELKTGDHDHICCPTCYWHHGQHASWCEKPDPYSCRPTCTEATS